MSELEEKLSAILSNPQAMGQIMSLAQSLGGGGSDKASEEKSRPVSPPPAEQDDSPDLSALLGNHPGGGESGGLDPRLLTLASRVMEEYQREDDGRAVLLQALRPYVKEKRYAKLNRAIQIARLSRLVRVALDVFRGDSHV